MANRNPSPRTRFKPGAEWTGNAKGRPPGRSITAKLCELLGASTINGVPIEGGKTLADLLPSLDIVGISLHPFLSTVHFAETVPADMFDRLFALAKKPIAITESSYCAQPWSLTVNGTAVPFSGSPEKQRDFTARLLAAAARHRAPFVVMFTIRDYDALWKAFGKSDSALPWRDTGFYDEDGKPRPALEVWDSYLKRPRR